MSHLPGEEKYTPEIEALLKSVVDHYVQEDKEQRWNWLRNLRRMKLLWDGFTNTYYSEVAHDWRIFDSATVQDSATDQAYYDKPVNIFRAYLESIIAALSVTVPPVTCYPDDADNPDDLLTASAGNRAAALIYRHNNVPLVWLKGLFVYCTEGVVANLNYSHKDKSYGVAPVHEYEDVEEQHEITRCPLCGYELDDVKSDDKPFNPVDVEESPDVFEVELETPDPLLLPQMEEICPSCGEMMVPEVKSETQTFARIAKTSYEPKSRMKLECYGALNVKIPFYARKQSECPYLFYSYETHFANAIEEFPDAKNLPREGGSVSAYDQYEQVMRLPIQYLGYIPRNVVTIRRCWLRPSAFHVLKEDEAKILRDKFPDGAYIALVNDEIADIDAESLDDRWTLTHNPLADYLQHEPLGMLLTSIQEITNDIISLTVQTMEHGISQTFADPAVLNFKQYAQTEVIPGGVYPATPKTGKSLSESFHEIKTATLSREVMPFEQKIESLGQLVSGALPSLFGGQLEGSETASEYSMSRAQAMQRLQNTWKMLCIWWEQIFEKVIPEFFENMKDDERWVEKDNQNGFMNVFIRKAETSGKIGRISIEANESIPLNWAQQKDVIMGLLQQQNQQILAVLAHPENLPYLKRALGLTEMYIPGEDDRNKQYAEIAELINSTPLPAAPTIDPMTGQEVPGMEQPSVPVDPDVDNHQIEAEICRKWLVSDVGRDAKVNNPDGYMNVLLHFKQHVEIMQMQMMQQMPPPEEKGSTPEEKANEQSGTPITEETDVNAAV